MRLSPCTHTRDADTFLRAQRGAHALSGTCTHAHTSARRTQAPATTSAGGTDRGPQSCVHLSWQHRPPPPLDICMFQRYPIAPAPSSDAPARSRTPSWPYAATHVHAHMSTTRPRPCPRAPPNCPERRALHAMPLMMAALASPSAKLVPDRPSYSRSNGRTASAVPDRPSLGSTLATLTSLPPGSCAVVNSRSMSRSQSQFRSAVLVGADACGSRGRAAQKCSSPLSARGSVDVDVHVQFKTHQLAARA